jgi:hypothetical protein
MTEQSEEESRSSGERGGPSDDGNLGFVTDLVRGRTPVRPVRERPMDLFGRVARASYALGTLYNGVAGPRPYWTGDEAACFLAFVAAAGVAAYAGARSRVSTVRRVVVGAANAMGLASAAMTLRESSLRLPGTAPVTLADLFVTAGVVGMAVQLGHLALRNGRNGPPPPQKPGDRHQPFDLLRRQRTIDRP